MKLGGRKLFYQSVNEYLVKMREGLSAETIKGEMPSVYAYWLAQEADLKKILKNKDMAFWMDIQRVLLIDAKLVLLRSYINDYDFHGFPKMRSLPMWNKIILPLTKNCVAIV